MAILKKLAVRAVDDLWDAIARAFDTFAAKACENDFAATGHDRS